jgi:hypothetical protein
MRQYAPLKRRSTIILHGSTSQKTILNIILAAVRTLNLTKMKFICSLFNDVFSVDYIHDELERILKEVVVT